MVQFPPVNIRHATLFSLKYINKQNLYLFLGPFQHSSIVGNQWVYLFDEIANNIINRYKNKEPQKSFKIESRPPGIWSAIGSRPRTFDQEMCPGPGAFDLQLCPGPRDTRGMVRAGIEHNIKLKRKVTFYKQLQHPPNFVIFKVTFCRRKKYGQK